MSNHSERSKASILIAIIAATMLTPWTASAASTQAEVTWLYQVDDKYEGRDYHDDYEDLLGVTITGQVGVQYEKRFTVPSTASPGDRIEVGWMHFWHNGYSDAHDWRCGASTTGHPAPHRNFPGTSWQYAGSEARTCAVTITVSNTPGAYNPGSTHDLRFTLGATMDWECSSDPVIISGSMTCYDEIRTCWDHACSSKLMSTQAEITYTTTPLI